MIDRVVVLNDASSARGGATALALASITGFRKRGIPVTFIVGDDGDNAAMSVLGIGLVALDQKILSDAGSGRALLRGLYNPRTVDRVDSWIRTNDTPRTVYHVHTWSKILSPSLFRVLRLVADRLFISAHDFFLVCPNGGYMNYPRMRVCELKPMTFACLTTACDKRNSFHKLWRVARQGVRNAVFDIERRRPTILAIHEGMRAGLERGGIPASTIIAVPNPVQPFASERLQAERGSEFVFIGRLDFEKGPDLAASAAKVAKVKLRIIGDGPMKAELQGRYPEVIFSGHQPREMIASLLTEARALVMPSRYPEPFGLVAGEALGSGLPVILPKTALLSPAIAERDAGIAYDPSCEGDLAAVMARMMASDSDVERMSHNAITLSDIVGQNLESWIDTLQALYIRKSIKVTQKIDELCRTI